MKHFSWQWLEYHFIVFFLFHTLNPEAGKNSFNIVVSTTLIKESVDVGDEFSVGP